MCIVLQGRACRVEKFCVESERISLMSGYSGTMEGGTMGGREGVSISRVRIVFDHAPDSLLIDETKE